MRYDANFKNFYFKLLHPSKLVKVIALTDDLTRMCLFDNNNQEYDLYATPERSILSSVALPPFRRLWHNSGNPPNYISDLYPLVEIPKFIETCSESKWFMKGRSEYIRKEFTEKGMPLADKLHMSEFVLEKLLDGGVVHPEDYVQIRKTIRNYLVDQLPEELQQDYSRDWQSTIECKLTFRPPYKAYLITGGTLEQRKAKSHEVQIGDQFGMLGVLNSDDQTEIVVFFCTDCSDMNFEIAKSLTLGVELGSDFSTSTFGNEKPFGTINLDNKVPTNINPEEYNRIISSNFETSKQKWREYFKSMVLELEGFDNTQFIQQQNDLAQASSSQDHNVEETTNAQTSSSDNCGITTQFRSLFRTPGAASNTDRTTLEEEIRNKKGRPPTV